MNRTLEVRRSFLGKDLSEMGLSNGTSVARSAWSMGGTVMDCGRNHLCKDNEFFVFGSGVQRDFPIGKRIALIPKLEMFSLFNNANKMNPLTSPPPFNVPDPRPAQISVRMTFWQGWASGMTRPGSSMIGSSPSWLPHAYQSSARRMVGAI